MDQEIALQDVALTHQDPLLAQNSLKEVHQMTHPHHSWELLEPPLKKLEDLHNLDNF